MTTTNFEAKNMEIFSSEPENRNGFQNIDR